MGSIKERIEAIKGALLADKKKSIAMGVLLVILIVVCVRQIGGNSTPNQVVATPPTAPAAPVQVPVVANPAPEAPPKASAPSAVADPVVKMVTITGMPRDLSRNLFTTNEWRHFRLALPMVQDQVTLSKRGSKSSLWGAALSAIVATQREQRRELEETEKVLISMHLQSTMTGSLPMAYISGRLVREGESIDGFSVVQISDRRVVVRKGMHLHELVMP